MCQQDHTPKSAIDPERSQDVESPFLRVVDSADLFDGKNELMIRHRDSMYRLRHTSTGKLILTK
mgnify:FL=1